MKKGLETEKNAKNMWNFHNRFGKYGDDNIFVIFFSFFMISQPFKRVIPSYFDRTYRLSAFNIDNNIFKKFQKFMHFLTDNRNPDMLKMLKNRLFLLFFDDISAV